jgi:hypothetical protein
MLYLAALAENKQDERLVNARKFIALSVAGVVSCPTTFTRTASSSYFADRVAICGAAVSSWLLE